jgi:hypothetical protein
MIQLSTRPLEIEERDRLLAGARRVGPQAYGPYLVSAMIGLIFGTASAPVFTLLGMPRALALAVAVLVALGWFSLTRRRDAKARAARSEALQQGTVERITLSATRGLSVLDPARVKVGLLLDCGDGEVAYLALAAFPTSRAEWKSGEVWPRSFAMEWIPATSEVLASRADGEPQRVSGSTSLAALPRVTEDSRFVRMRRDELEPNELLLLDAKSSA